MDREKTAAAAPSAILLNMFFFFFRAMNLRNIWKKDYSIYKRSCEDLMPLVLISFNEQPNHTTENLEKNRGSCVGMNLFGDEDFL